MSNQETVAKFTEQIRRLFDSMGKYGIDFYKETKEKKEIELEDQKKVLREEKIKVIRERIEICKNVTRDENLKKKNKTKVQVEEVIEEVEEEVLIQIDDDNDQDENFDDDGGGEQNNQQDEQNRQY